MHNNIMPIKTNSQYFSIFQLVMFDVWFGLLNKKHIEYNKKHSKYQCNHFKTLNGFYQRPQIMI